MRGADGAAVLEARALVCGHRAGRPTLEGVTLSVPRSRTVVLVGPSGGGKTTLLRTLLGLVPARGGIVTVLGATAPERPPAGAVGYIPQGLGLVRHATVLRNVLLGTLHELGPLARVVGAFGREQVLRAQEVLALVGLAHKAHTLPLHLSGGERRRVAIARALAQRPRLLLADEILSELDHASRGTVLGAVRGLQAETGMGLLMVEHDLEVALDIGDTICCVGRGTITATLERGPQRRRRLHEVVGAGG